MTQIGDAHLSCRVSGNVVNDFVLGSIMSAVHMYGVRLVVVLGHTRCGMVARAIQHWAKHEHKKALDGLGAASTQVCPALHSPPHIATAAARRRWPLHSCTVVLWPGLISSSG